MAKKKKKNSVKRTRKTTTALTTTSIVFTITNDNKLNKGLNEAISDYISTLGKSLGIDNINIIYHISYEEVTFYVTKLQDKKEEIKEKLIDFIKQNNLEHIIIRKDFS